MLYGAADLVDVWCLHAQQARDKVHLLVNGGAHAALGFLLMVVGLMAWFEETRIALIVGPAFLVLLTVLFYVFKLYPADKVTSPVTTAG